MEKEFVRQWRTRGVDAEASVEVLPAGVALDKAGVAPITQALGFDSVLVTRLIKREAINPQIPGRLLKQPPRRRMNPDLTQYVRAVVASPEYDIDYGDRRSSPATSMRCRRKSGWVLRAHTDAEWPERFPPPAFDFVRVVLSQLYHPES